MSDDGGSCLGSDFDSQCEYFRSDSSSADDRPLVPTEVSAVLATLFQAQSLTVNQQVSIARDESIDWDSMHSDFITASRLRLHSSVFVYLNGMHRLFGVRLDQLEGVKRARLRNVRKHLEDLYERQCRILDDLHLRAKPQDLHY